MAVQAQARIGVVGAGQRGMNADPYAEPDGFTAHKDPAFWVGVYAIAALAFILLLAHGARGFRRR